MWAGRSFAGENALVSRSSAVRHLLVADRLPHVDRDPLPAAPALLRRRRAHGRRRRARRVVFIGRGHVVRPHRAVAVVGSSLALYLGYRASSAAVGARRAPEAARVHARASPDPPSFRDGGETSSIAIVSMTSWFVGSSARRRIKKKSKKLIVEWQCRGTRPSRWIRRLIWRKMAMEWLLDST